MSKIIVVDDSKTDMLFIRSMLEEHDVLSAYDGDEAMDLLAENADTDLMILDLNMPRMNGFEVLSAMQKKPMYASVTTIILTNYDEVENEVKGLMLGAVDYIRKPLNIESLKKRIDVHLSVRNIRQHVEKHNRILEQMVMERTKELLMTRELTIHALTKILELRHIETPGHSDRIRNLMKLFCDHLAKQPTFSEVLTPAKILELCHAAPLHDIGAAGFSDHLLEHWHKPQGEVNEMIKRHITYGVEALKGEDTLTENNSFRLTAIEMIESHHEHYDGSGYPKGLMGNQIPLSGRILALLDAYDLLLQPITGQAPCGPEVALSTIEKEEGTRFDPDLVKALRTLMV